MQVARDLMLAANPRPPEPRDQDERDAPPPRPPMSDLVVCPRCGLRFTYATKGMARMQRALHLKRAHPDDVEAG
jgi:hypothetical protein